MGTLNRAVKRVKLSNAITMANSADKNTRTMGQHILAELKYHYRRVSGSKPSGAAAAKRASARRSNISARASKRA